MIYLNLILAIIGVNIVMMFMYKRENHGGYGKVVRLPKLYLGIGIVGMISGILPMLPLPVYNKDSQVWWVYLLFSIVLIVGIGFLLAYVNWFIIVEKDHFLYRSMFRKIYKVLYTDVIDCKISDIGVTIKTKYRTFEVDRNLPGIRDLGQRLKSQTRKNAN